jgi:enoyl-CoA hydratase/carnithine racemase
MSQDLVMHRDGPITTIAFNRPDKGNTLSSAMLAELEQLARSLADDEQTRVVIIRAEGDNFSFGADLGEMEARTERPSVLALRRKAELGGRMMRSLQEIHQPTICAIQGISTGGATCIASACDFRIASDTARMGYGEVKLGINLMWHAVPPCVHLVGPSRAKQLIMSGKLIAASTLAQWGFVDEICPREDLDARARAWAEEYAALPPIAVQMIKRSINQVSGALDQAIMHADTDQWLLGTQTEDFREAVSAFMEKRKPEFKGN